MKFIIKKIYIILLLLTLISQGPELLAKDSTIKYTKENISNYFLGIVSLKKNYNDKAIKHLKKIESLKNHHSQYNVELLKTLVLLEQFEKAFSFSKKVWHEDDLLFEVDLLLGLDYLLKKKYTKAEKHFERLNEDNQYNIFFDDFISTVLLAWTEAGKGNKEKSFKYLNSIPGPYEQLKEPQNIFLQCYFDAANTQKSFENLENNKRYNFSRYNFFLVNYLLSKNKNNEALIVIKNSRKKYNSNILIKQTEEFILNNKNKKIKSFFDCKNLNDNLAEFFYVMANFYSNDQNYKLSNFYLKISLFLNNRFLPNKALLAENYYYQNKNKKSKKIYSSLKPIGSVYSWYASKNITRILLKEKSEKYSLNKLKEEFNSLPKLNLEHYYDLANFYKDNNFYEESVKYYSSALKMTKKNHFLFAKILDRRGTSFERLGDWENAEQDLIESLKILPDQANVLNYLAYTWVDKGINLDEAFIMLNKANKLQKNDPYIIDSLGWAYYAKKKYPEAKLHLQRALELLPLDPIINDHYADTLWMLNKDIQARYIWSHILEFNETGQKLKDTINKKLIFGITKKL